jgi:hypothetical protein
MDARLFQPGRLNLAEDLFKRGRMQRSPRLELAEAAQ